MTDILKILVETGNSAKNVDEVTYSLEKFDTTLSKVGGTGGKKFNRKTLNELKKYTEDFKEGIRTSMETLKMKGGDPEGFVKTELEALQELFKRRYALLEDMQADELDFFKNRGVKIGPLNAGYLKELDSAHLKEKKQLQRRYSEKVKQGHWFKVEELKLLKDDYKLGLGSENELRLKRYREKLAAEKALADVEKAIAKAEETRLKNRHKLESDQRQLEYAKKYDKGLRLNVVQLLEADRLKVKLGEVDAANLKKLKDQANAEKELAKAAETAEKERLANWLRLKGESAKEENARLAAIRSDSLKRGKELILKAAKEELAALNSAQAEQQRASDLWKSTSLQDKQKALKLGWDPSKMRFADFAKDFDKLDNANKSLSKSFSFLNKDMFDAHSTARGLASAFNLLWLTWGSLIPLFAGAGISYSVKKTFDIGVDVEKQITMMEVLGQVTKDGGQIIRAELRKIDQESLFSLTELTKSVVQMGQAGADAKQALEMIRPAAALGVVGQTDLETSTSVLQQGLKVFSMGTDEAGKLAAQMFQATKSAALSVKDLGESLKYASTSNVLYGQTSSEVLAFFAAISEVGIKGSMAGTGFTNLLHDLQGRSGPATKALNALEKATNTTLSSFDKFGKQKSSIVQLRELVAALDKIKDPQKALDIQNKILSERGLRVFGVGKRLGADRLAEIEAQIKGASLDDLYAANQRMMDTVGGSFDILKATMVGKLDEVFEVTSDRYKKFFKDMAAAIESPEFKAGILRVVQTVFSLFDVISAVTPYVVAFGKAFLAWRSASFALGLLSSIGTTVGLLLPQVAGMTAALKGASFSFGGLAGVSSLTSGSLAKSGAQMLGAAAAAKAVSRGLDEAAVAAARSAAVASATSGAWAKFGAGLLGFLANPIVGVITTVGLLAASFLTLPNAAKEGGDALTDYLDSSGKIQIDKLEAVMRKKREHDALLGGGTSPLLANLATEASNKVAKEQKVLDDAKDFKSPATVIETFKKNLIAAQVAEEAIQNQLQKEMTETAKRENAREAAIRAKAEAAMKGKGGGVDINLDGGKSSAGGFGPARFSPMESIIKREMGKAAELASTLAREGKATTEYEKNLAELNETYKQAFNSTEQLTDAELERLKTSKPLTDAEYKKLGITTKLTAEKLAKLNADRVEAEGLIKANALKEREMLLMQESLKTIQKVKDATLELAQARAKAADDAAYEAENARRAIEFTASLDKLPPSAPLYAQRDIAIAKNQIQLKAIEDMRKAEEDTKKALGDLGVGGAMGPDNLDVGGGYNPISGGTQIPGIDNRDIGSEGIPDRGNQAMLAREYQRLADEKKRIMIAAGNEEATAVAQIYKDKWREATNVMADDFVNSLMNKSFTFKEFLKNQFNNLVLRPQLQLVSQQGFDALGTLFKAGMSLLGATLPGTSLGGLNPSGMGGSLGADNIDIGGGQNFEGGGYTGNGPRAGGLDGRGGFMAMVHPNETVIDHTRGQSASAPVYVTINNTVGDVATKSMLEQSNAATVKQIQAGLYRSSRYNGAMAR